MIVLKIQGMMCQHCLESVKSALTSVEGAVHADVSLDSAIANVECNDNVTKDMLIKAVNDKGFDAE